MKTARTILSEITKRPQGYINIGVVEGEQALEAMELYSQQQACEFSEWYRNEPFENTMNKTEAELYQQWKESLNKEELKVCSICGYWLYKDGTCLRPECANYTQKGETNNG